MMRKHRRTVDPPPGNTRKLEGHGLVEPDTETSHFANALKDHDEGDYYALDQHEEEEYLFDDEEEISDECEEPEQYYGSRSKSSKGKGGDSYYGNLNQRRQLQEDRPRIHGAHHQSHQISDMRATLAAELEDSE